LAGLDVNQGVVVDSYLTTSHPNVLAAGDVAEHRGTVYGVWGPSQYMGDIAGRNAAGLGAEFGGIPRSNTLEVLGLEIFSIGLVEPRDASFRVIEDETDGQYCHFLFRDSYLEGAILLGDTSLTVAVKKAVEDRQDFSALLKTRPTAQDVKSFFEE
jgi:NAD(P)H-nitrite reductase large subunit